MRRAQSRGGRGMRMQKGIASLSRKQKNLLEDLQMRLSENIDRAPPMTAKQHRETARRGALYGHNPIALFKKPKYKRPKSAPFGRGVIQDPTYEDPSSRVLKSAAAGRMHHSEDWKNIGCGREGAVWTLTEPKETDLRRDLPPEDWRPTITGPPRDWPNVTIAAHANAEANTAADITGKHLEDGVAPGKPQWIVPGTPAFDRGGWYKFSPRSRRNLAKGFTRSTPLSRSLPSSSFKKWTDSESKVMKPSASMRSMRRKSSRMMTPKRSRSRLPPRRGSAASTVSRSTAGGRSRGGTRRDSSDSALRPRSAAATARRRGVRSNPHLPMSPDARRRLAQPPTLETPLGEDAYKCREIVENEQLAIAQLLTHTYGSNDNNTVPEPLGRFAEDTMSRKLQRRLHMNWMAQNFRDDCGQCIHKNKHFREVMDATKHGDPPITVAGATKKRSKARKVYMPSGATIMHSTSLRRNDVVALLAAKGVEAEKRRGLREACIHFMVNHRTFVRLDFAEVLRAAKLRVKADDSVHKNLFANDTNTAVDKWIAAQQRHMLGKQPVYLTRGQFIRVMRNFGFDSKVDMREMNRMFSSYDVHARDYVDMNIFCTGFFRYQTKMRAMRFGQSYDAGGVGSEAGKAEAATAAAMGGAAVADVITSKPAFTASEEKRSLLDVADFYPDD